MSANNLCLQSLDSSWLLCCVVWVGLAAGLAGGVLCLASVQANRVKHKKQTGPEIDFFEVESDDTKQEVPLSYIYEKIPEEYQTKVQRRNDERTKVKESVATTSTINLQRY